MGNIINDGGTITFSAALDNTGQTFKFGSDTGTWLFSGRVTSGTVDLGGATVVPIIGAASPSLDGVTLAGDVHVGNQATANVPSLAIRNGINAAGHTISVVNTGSPAGATVTFVLNSSLTVDNAKVSLANATMSMATQSSDTLTLGPLAVVSGSGAITGSRPPLASGVDYDNEGQIVANVSKQTLAVRPASLLNFGTMAATDGGVLSIALSPSAPWTNDGILSAGAGSRITVAQNLTMADGSALDVSFDPSGAFGLLQVNGNLDLSHVEALDLDVPPGTPAGTYSIVTYTGSLTGVFDQVTPGYAVDYSTPGEVRVTVPEPAAAGSFALLAGVGLLCRRRQKRR